MKSIVKLLIILLTALVSIDASAKDSRSAGLKKQRQQAEQRAKAAEQRLHANREALRLNLNELTSIDAESELLSRRIESMTRTSDSLRAVITPLADSITMMTSRLDTMKAAYTRALKKSYRNRSSIDRMSYIFSASSFSQAWKRGRSLRQFAEWRRIKAADLVETRDLLKSQKSRLDSMSEANERLLRNISRDRNDLEAKRSRISRLISQIEASNTDLQHEINSRNSEMARLDDQITQAVAAEEAEKKRIAAESSNTTPTTQPKEPAASSVTSSNVKIASTPPTPKINTEDLSSRFESLKGRIASPVDGKKIIVKKFGRQQHPRLPKVFTENAGIDIETDRGTKVKAVFDGEVSQIFKISGYNNVVVLRHGNYVTVYANIVDLNVTKGQIIPQGYLLGSVYVDTSDNNRSVLHFEVRREKEKLNPEDWLIPLK